jgi:outer membrane lipoprotein-sorting protein
MRKVLFLSAAVCLTLTLAGRASAQDESRAVIAKAVKAAGGAKKLGKLKVARAKFKGKGEFEGAPVALTGEIATQLPRQMRLEVQAEVQGVNVTVLNVVNGDKGWLQVLGKTMPLEDEELKDQQEGLHAEYVQTLVPLLKDKGFTLDALGEARVNGRAAVGVRVASKGHKDVNLYFDKATGLLTKSERRALDDARKEVTEETFYSDHKDVDGVKVPMKVVVHHDGKKFLEMEVTEYRFLDRIDDSEFARPEGEESAARSAAARPEPRAALTASTPPSAEER